MYVAVPDRNRILFHRVFRAHRSPTLARNSAKLTLGAGLICVLCGRIRYSCIYIVHMSPTLSGSSALQHIKPGDALEICDGITFDFYLGLPHILNYIINYICNNKGLIIYIYI